MTTSFVKAVKSQAKLRLAMSGPSGSGKTYSALAIAMALADGGPVALVDTEHGSAKKYADDFSFDVLEMEPPFHPDRFVEAIVEAAKAGYAVVILDSLSHAWNGTGGLLEIVDQIAARMKTSNTFSAWKDATPIQNRLIDAIVRSDIHIIATMRSKHEYVVEQVERNGKTVSVPKKIGMAPVQRDSFEYEFDIVAELDLDHNLIISKTRCKALDSKVFNKPGVDIAAIIKTWLSDGEKPEPYHWSRDNKKRDAIAGNVAKLGAMMDDFFAVHGVQDWGGLAGYEGEPADAWSFFKEQWQAQQKELAKAA